ncbi:hypothetical protein LINPERHAP2_LOCUS26140 [Linum perenne]
MKEKEDPVLGMEKSRRRWERKRVADVALVRQRPKKEEDKGHRCWFVESQKCLPTEEKDLQKYVKTLLGREPDSSDLSVGRVKMT